MHEQPPFVSSELIAFLRPAHGFYNLCMLVLFLSQGVLGWQIRRARKGGIAVPFVAVRRHRTLGPVLVPWGIIGFAAGIVLVFLDKGGVAKHPLHFGGGVLVAGAILISAALSRRISADDSPARDRHAVAGAVLIALYLLQSVLGLAILL